jgi:hypothetical protein
VIFVTLDLTPYAKSGLTLMTIKKSLAPFSHGAFHSIRGALVQQNTDFQLMTYSDNEVFISSVDSDFNQLSKWRDFRASGRGGGADLETDKSAHYNTEVPEHKPRKDRAAFRISRALTDACELQQ